MDTIMIIFSSTVIASIVSGIISLIVARNDYGEKRIRALWLFENYIAAAGKCIGSWSVESIENYQQEYYRCVLYMIDDNIYEDMKNLDILIHKHDEGNSRTELEMIIKQYSMKYDLKNFKSKKNI